MDVRQKEKRKIEGNEEKTKERRRKKKGRKIKKET